MKWRNQKGSFDLLRPLGAENAERGRNGFYAYKTCNLLVALHAFSLPSQV